MALLPRVRCVCGNTLCIIEEYSSVRHTGWTLDPGPAARWMARSSSRVCLSAQMPARRDGDGVQRLRLRLGDTDTRVSSRELELERASIQPPVQVEVEVEVEVGVQAYPGPARFACVCVEAHCEGRTHLSTTKAGMESGVNGTHETETETSHGCISSRVLGAERTSVIARHSADRGSSSRSRRAVSGHHDVYVATVQWFGGEMYGYDGGTEMKYYIAVRIVPGKRVHHAGSGRSFHRPP
ncbi:hypothetical protein C8F04DRAFT_1185101 [Mycena alexandri]|uniref:Uncharacterized protein n=1 Tax=Mycena alexandri TaxID=1745969 RepID=A0AAD6SU30_9AGAR|nr:hypothetical protein C8F04DRAFT_1185101 [Mycena alexandri]